MTILVYGEKASRTHENQMLQVFLEKIENRWGHSDDRIVVIANSMWNGAEIDLVCMLPSAIIVADFKGYGGKVTGSENGPWQADGIVVKGGNKSNPYQQLRDNKFSVMSWLKSKGLLTGRNLGHISAGVIFSKKIDDHLDLSVKVRSWFYPTDLNNCSLMLEGLSSPELIIARNEAQEILQNLGVQPLTWASSKPQLVDLEEQKDLSFAYSPLTENQKEALFTINNFIASDEFNSFAVHGMTSTGKSRLLVEVEKELLNAGKQAVVLTPNRRLSNKTDTESTSIYTYLFSGGKYSDDGPEVESEQQKLKVIPLRHCDDDDDCIYLIDDAHLLSNSTITFPDGKQYGSGKLLSDFFAFSELINSRRKVIFFGDSYQIKRAHTEESILLGTFQESHGVRHQSLELKQLIDTTGGSAKLSNAAMLVSAIKNENFSAMNLSTDESFRILENKEIAAKEIREHFQRDPSSTWFLAETHRRVNTFTQWIRERLFKKQNLNTLESGDLLEIYVCPDITNHVGTTFSLKSGSCQTIKQVYKHNTYEQSLKNIKNGPIRFSSISCTFEIKDSFEFKILEEFLTAEKSELDKDTAVAESVWRAIAQKYASDCKRIETELELPDIPKPPPPQTPAPPYPRPDFVYARYGYASTVHHAQGMTRPTCYVNCDHSAGSHSEGFFRWLYSAITTAENEVVLINYADIHPFDAANWNIASVNISSEFTIGAGWKFMPNGIVSESDQQRSFPNGLDQSKNLFNSAAIWLHVLHAVDHLNWKITKANCHPYQEQYDLVGPQNEQCQLRISYNGKNVISGMHVNDTQHWPFLTNLAYECLFANNYSPVVKNLFHLIQSRINNKNWKVVSATETNYRLMTTLVRHPTEFVEIEINFDKQGLVSTVRALNASNINLLDELKEFLL